MYLVAVTTAETIQDTTYVYLHPRDGRMQLSPTPEPIPSREDANRALDLAVDFYDVVGPYARYATLIGPDGPIHSSYYGPKEDGLYESLVRKHDSALSKAGIKAITRR